MPRIDGMGTTYNLPNYTGELFGASPEDTPLLSMIGGLTSGESVASTLFEWQGYDLREIRLAMNCHATDPQWGHRRPAPSDIIRHLTETLPARRREAHVAKVRALREKIEPLDERFRRLKSALDLGILPDESKRKVYAEMNGIAMQTAALNRELSLLVDDRPKLTMGREPALLAASLPEIEHGRE